MDEAAGVEGEAMGGGWGEGWVVKFGGVGCRCGRTGKRGAVDGGPGRR